MACSSRRSASGSRPPSRLPARRSTPHEASRSKHATIAADLASGVAPPTSIRWRHASEVATLPRRLRSHSVPRVSHEAWNLRWVRCCCMGASASCAGGGPFARCRPICLQRAALIYRDIALDAARAVIRGHLVSIGTSIAGSETTNAVSPLFHRAFAALGIPIQRRGWDSNPRGACTPNGFQDRPVRPLRHPAGGHCDRGLRRADFGRRTVARQHLGHAALEVLEDREERAVRDHRPVQRVRVFQRAALAAVPDAEAA